MFENMKFLNYENMWAFRFKYIIIESPFMLFATCIIFKLLKLSKLPWSHFTSRSNYWYLRYFFLWSSEKMNVKIPVECLTKMWLVKFGFHLCIVIKSSYLVNQIIILHRYITTAVMTYFHFWLVFLCNDWKLQTTFKCVTSFPYNIHSYYLSSC